MTDNQLGPNVKKLIIHKVSLDVFSKGGGIADGIKFLSDKKSIIDGFHVADEWVKNAILVVRNATEPNPWKAATDEEIASEILRRIEEQREALRK